MLDFLRQVIKPKYEPLNRVEVLSQNLVDNYNYLKGLQPGAEIWPVLKSNAYGHGLKEICKILKHTDVKMVVVDSYPEAQVVYKYLKQAKVLILGEMPYEVYKYCKFDRTEFVIYNTETLKYLSTETLKHKNTRARIHLFINTGMNREGAQKGKLDKLIELIKKNSSKIEFTGLCSHLASADTVSNLNKKQEKNFFEALKYVEERGLKPKWVHLGNSAGVFILDNKRLNAFRVGLGFYGYNIFNKNHPDYKRAQELKPALRVTSEVVVVQDLEPGDKVSYNETFTVDKPIRTAVIPFGYTEGLDRRLSNKAKFKVKAKDKEFYAKVAGRVCMNLTVLNCGHKKVKIGDKIEVISENPDALNSVQNLVEIMETIPYELLVKLNLGIRRVVI